MIVMFSARRLKPGAWEQFRRAWDPGDATPPGLQRIYHARNIRDFLAWSNNPNDVVASDFVGRLVRVRMPLLRSSKVRERLNRRIAHLSYSRLRLGREWDVPLLITEIDSAMGAFLRRLEQVQPALVNRLRGAA